MLKLYFAGELSFSKKNKTKTQSNICWTPLYANNVFLKSNHV